MESVPTLPFLNTLKTSAIVTTSKYAGPRATTAKEGDPSKSGNLTLANRRAVEGEEEVAQEDHQESKKLRRGTWSRNRSGWRSLLASKS